MYRLLFNCQILVAKINVMLCYRDIVVCTAYVNLNLDINTIQFYPHLIARIDDFTSEKFCLFTCLRTPRDYAVLPWTLVLSLSCCFNVTAQPMKLRLVKIRGRCVTMPYEYSLSKFTLTL